jgi:hypothetical protein
VNAAPEDRERAQAIDLSKAFHEWMHGEMYGEDAPIYEYSYECADMERAYEAGHEAAIGESFGPPGTGTPVGIAVEIGSDELAGFLASAAAARAFASELIDELTEAAEAGEGYIRADTATLAAWREGLDATPDIQSDLVGRALVNIGRYLPPGVRVRVRATYRANDETRAAGRIEIPR